ncbi:capsule biosynthesis protein [Mucilaginibacter sp. PPCGB 2223]|uniref:SLBB domain-containing protein n=1 Tax=Mucilaginibacter sp. PPCGB 2223 TaxID=1886027 RepID=UPI000826FF2C|nr:SLBB domain-containing protein [Mucilaginibacter sp. PPCGB 2223]OCX53938.1 capsule biosynthesis protein [Mucilaginibacter sp. PPCGB 2223]
MRYCYRVLILLLLFICIQNTNALFAQTITPANIGTVKVDELTDAQLSELIKQAQATGMSDAQLRSLAISKGMSEDDANKLQTRINLLRNNGNNVNNSQTGSRQLNYTPQTANKNIPADSRDTSKLRVFGADLFNGSDITFEPNLRIATPQNYVLGPDDQVLIDVNGVNVANWKLTVSPDGTIQVPNVALINVNGKTIEQAKALISNKLIAAHYAIGNGATLAVTLGNIRSIRVTITGEITKPGTYTLSSLTTLFGALYASGGPNNNGSLRQIKLIRDNRIIRTADVYDFILKGIQKDNIRLQDGDVINIPTYKVRVALAGEVKHPALFEVLPGETLRSVINFAGGFTDIAYTASIKATQVTDKELRVTDISSDDYSNYIPLRGDQYAVGKILERFENRVIINGAVFRPGQFELDKGLTLSQLIAKAAGLKEDAFASRGYITRLKPDNTTENIPFDVKAIMSKTSADIPLQREDVVTIPSIFDLRDNYKVTIKGEVRKAGDFDYADNMTIEDLIVRAGGFAEGASAKRIEIARRINNSDPNQKGAPVAQVFVVDVDSQLKFSTSSFILQPFDEVSVFGLPGFEKQRTVKIEGEVLYPGPYAISSKNEKISSLVKRAGGLTAYADIEGGTLRRTSDNGGLDSDKGKLDSAILRQNRLDRLLQLQKTFKDSTNNVLEQVKNDNVGIDLKKILDNPGSDIDLILEEGDVLIIPKQQQLVKVNGEVLFPSSVIYSSSKSLRGYVDNAGGFSPDALRRRAYVVYANGTVKSTHTFLFFRSYPKIKAGSQIVVPKKPVTRGLSAAESVGLLGGLASMGAVIIGIISLVKK